MRQQGKKALAYILILCFVCSLTGCSLEKPDGTSVTLSESTVEKSEVSVETETSKEAENDEPETANTFTINISMTSDSRLYNEETINKLNDYIGLNMNVIYLPSENAFEKNLLYLAAPKSMPEIMTMDGTFNADGILTGKRKLFVDLSTMISDGAKYPNLSKLPWDVLKNFSINGRVIAIPKLAPSGEYGFAYREDWAEKLNVALPEKATFEDVYNMLYAFTYSDPDEDGKDNTYGIEYVEGSKMIDIMLTWFGLGNGFLNTEEGLIPNWKSEGFLDAMDNIKTLFDDGLVYEADVSGNSVSEGKAGAMADTYKSEKKVSESVKLNMYGSINGATLAGPGYDGFYVLSQETLETPEKVEAALSVLDRLNDTEAVNMTGNGAGSLYSERNEDGSLATHYDNAVTNPALNLLMLSETYLLKGKELDAAIENLKIQYVYGDVDRDEFEETISDILENGYNKIIDEINVLYKNMK